MNVRNRRCICQLARSKKFAVTASLLSGVLFVDLRGIHHLLTLRVVTWVRLPRRNVRDCILDHHQKLARDFQQHL